MCKVFSTSVLAEPNTGNKYNKYNKVHTTHTAAAGEHVFSFSTAQRNRISYKIY